MESMTPPKTFKVYALIKQSGTSLMMTGVSGAMSWGTGFYNSLQEAEHNRTIEILKDTTVGKKPQFHVFELDIPNPLYTE